MSPPAYRPAMARSDDTTRDRLLDAAEGLFGARGYEAVGIREIAERAGVNLSGIKYHFGSKRGLYLEVIRLTMDRRGSTAAWAILDEPIDSRESAAAALQAFVTAFLGVLLEHDGDDSCACLIMQSAMEAGDATDLVVREFIKPHHERLCELVGVLRPDATAQARSRYAQSVMALMLHQRMFRPFLDRLGEQLGTGASGEEAVGRIAGEIAAFSLCGMGCGDMADTTQTTMGAADSAASWSGDTGDRI
jgi:AcrR family transcriptional regulator